MITQMLKLKDKDFNAVTITVLNEVKENITIMSKR